ncbi:CCA tRNA nucleotidyltransferase [Sulfuriroseicoccus oceanibius]|uniref:CCA tRNA nucleotidyltransferase n=1 Tax=Sulfuriroseicoccus oceanibius TaxID=2707525 RepID=A0A6B3L6A2_9BACT|nr:CCA tRNA nucleotidyltransferase [Sulfuriroseicoccus oceanibius]QQL46129.1 CCA tRNA nucleotidyltransferase [Sulfuriroseicoccus oceanibius]
MTDPLRQAACSVVATLTDAGFTAFFAGGCVRDRLMGNHVKDYDIATNATPQQVAAAFSKVRMVGAHFGVALVHYHGFDFEVATFREDGSYGDGRRPDSVCYSTPEKDAHRRDFTINGLFENPATGEVIDFIGGQQDLDARTLRAIGDAETRFAEDYLRMLRAVRFAARFDLKIEESTWVALQAHAPQITQISVERIFAEVRTILTHPNRVRGFDLLVESGLMQHILPEIIQLQGCDQPPEFHPEGDVYQHTRIMLDMIPADASEALVWAVLLHDIAKPATRTVDETGRIRFNGHDRVGAEMAEEILRRLKAPNHLIDAVRPMVARHMTFMNVTKMKRSTLRRFMDAPTFTDEIELHRVDCASSNGITENYEFVLAKRDEFANEPVVPPPLVTGRDLIERGHKPGPNLGKILNEIQTLQLDGQLTTRDDALAWLDANG